MVSDWSESGQTLLHMRQGQLLSGVCCLGFVGQAQDSYHECGWLLRQVVLGFGILLDHRTWYFGLIVLSRYRPVYVW